MNRIGGLREEIQLGAALRKQLEQWLIATNPALAKQITQIKQLAIKSAHDKINTSQ